MFLGFAFTIRIRSRISLGVFCMRIGFIGVILGGSYSVFFDVRTLIIILVLVEISVMFVALGVMRSLMGIIACIIGSSISIRITDVMRLIIVVVCLNVMSLLIILVVFWCSS
jgi:hypothetical protein